MTGPAPAAPVPIPPHPVPLAPEPAASPPAPGAEGTDHDGDPLRDGFDEGAQPDPFAEATSERPATASERASVAPRRPQEARSSAEALAEAAAGERLELLRSVFPGRVLRLVPHAAQGGAGAQTPAPDDADAEPLDVTADPNGVDTDPTEPGGSP